MSDEMSYVGVADCGCIRAACVDWQEPSFRNRVADFCAEMIRGGLKLEHRDIVSVRAASWSCPKCDPRAYAKQIEMMPHPTGEQSR